MSQQEMKYKHRIQLDLVQFEKNGFQKVLKELGITNQIPRKVYLRKTPAWLWENNNLDIKLSNNPITGKMALEGLRKDEKDYGSYTTLYADNQDKLLKAFKQIIKNAVYIKEFEEEIDRYESKSDWKREILNNKQYFTRILETP